MSKRRSDLCPWWVAAILTVAGFAAGLLIALAQTGAL